MRYKTLLPKRTCYFLKADMRMISHRTTQGSDIWDDWHPSLQVWRQLLYHPKYRTTGTL